MFKFLLVIKPHSASVKMCLVGGKASQYPSVLQMKLYFHINGKPEIPFPGSRV